MKDLLKKFQTNSLQIGIFVNDDGNEYFVGTVGRKPLGQIVYNSFQEWDGRIDITSHFTHHSDGVKHHRGPRDLRFNPKPKEKPDHTLDKTIPFLATGIHKGMAKYIKVATPLIFKNKFVVPDEQLGSVELRNTTLINVELVPQGMWSSISEHIYAEILKQQSFIEEPNVNNLPNIVITHVRNHQMSSDFVVQRERAGRHEPE